MSSNVEHMFGSSSSLLLGDANPLKSDPELIGLLKRLDQIKKYKTFSKWKSKFLDRLETFLYQDGMDPATKATADFEVTLQKFVKKIVAVQACMDRGDLTETKKTVKSSLALNEMCNTLETVRVAVQNLIPSSSQEEKQRKFTKFHLGAVLIRQGFHQYVTLTQMQDALTVIGTELKNVADRQQLDLFAAYSTQLQRFVDVLADLNLYEIMLKCIEFAEPPEEEESSDEEIVMIPITVEHSETGRSIQLEVDQTETVENLKSMITNFSALEPARQVLTLAAKELDNDSQTLLDAGVVANSKLIVSPYMLPITVRTMDGKTMELLVNPANYLSDLKRQLEKVSGMAPSNQKLFLDGEELADNNKHISDYEVVAGAVLDLEPKAIIVNAQTPDGKIHAIEISPHETAHILREKLQKPTGIPPNKQVIQHVDKELPSSRNDATMCELGIADGDSLTVEPFRMPVIVNTIDGVSKRLWIDPSDYLSDIKRQIEKETGMPAKNQRLLLKGNELNDNNMTADQLNIEAESVLDLEPKEINIEVQTPDGKIYPLTIDPNVSCDAMKESIGRRTGIPAVKQKITFDGLILPPGNESVRDLGIKDKSLLQVAINTFPVTVKTMDGQNIEIMVDPTDKLSSIKKQLEAETGLQGDNQCLFLDGKELLDDNAVVSEYGITEGTVLDLEPMTVVVNVIAPDGKTYPTMISLTNDVDTLKAKVETLVSIPIQKLQLKLDGEKVVLGAQTLKELGVRDGSNIMAEIFRVPVTVRMMAGNIINKMVDPTDTLLALKELLQSESNLHPSNQRLWKGGIELEDDMMTAAQHGIEDGSVLDLEPKAFNISARMPNGQLVQLGVTPSDTDDSLKDQIAKEAGMPQELQLLKFQGKVLPLGQSIKSIGIEDGSTIDVETTRIPVTVRTMDGKHIELLVDPTDTIGDVKEQLQQESGLLAANQRLFMDGTDLSDDGCPAMKYGVQSGSVLDLEPKSLSVCIQTPDGKEHLVNIAPNDTMDRLKQKISEQTGLEVPRQVLKLNGKELPNSGLTVRQTGIRDGSKISVEPFKVPITVRTMDEKVIRLMIEPLNPIRDIKYQLEAESGILESNQRLSMGTTELSDDSRKADDYAIKANSLLDLEPKSIAVNVQLPDGTTQAVNLTPSDTSDMIKERIAKQTGMEAPRQIVKFNGRKLISNGHTVKELGIREGSILIVEVLRHPIKVKTPDGTMLSLKVEPCDTIDNVKIMIERETGMLPKRQTLKFGDKELNNGNKTCAECGVREGAILLVEPNSDPIIFVDIKCGTLFAVERDDAIQRQALTPFQGNKLDFTEATKDSATREKILQSMKESPTLGVATQVVVQKMDIEDITLEEAEKVKSMWGVNLKKREKNKKGEEFIFIDPKTGACGELPRKKYIEMNFITVVPFGKGETLAEREKDTMAYDKYVFAIRQIFGIRAAT